MITPALKAVAPGMEADLQEAYNNSPGATGVETGMSLLPGSAFNRILGWAGRGAVGKLVSRGLGEKAAERLVGLGMGEALPLGQRIIDNYQSQRPITEGLGSTALQAAPFAVAGQVVGEAAGAGRAKLQEGYHPLQSQGPDTFEMGLIRGAHRTGDLAEAAKAWSPTITSRRR
jgi:hypothetical protein